MSTFWKALVGGCVVGVVVLFVMILGHGSELLRLNTKGQALTEWTDSTDVSGPAGPFWVWADSLRLRVAHIDTVVARLQKAPPDHHLPPPPPPPDW